MTVDREPLAWLPYFKTKTQAGVRLFCLPYAGGGAHTFRQWITALPPFIEVCPIQLPGRGNRLKDPPFTKLPPLVKAISEAIRPYLDKPFAFFGHSMGAVVGFELSRQLRRAYSLQPVHLFISGSCAPQQLNEERPFYHLPEPDFLKAVRRFNGMPEEIFEESELLQLILPALRADFSVCQTYIYVPEAPLGCPITAFGGSQDHGVSQSCLKAWRSQTKSAFSVKIVPGDHFFINTAQQDLLRVISLKLQQWERARE